MSEAIGRFRFVCRSDVRGYYASIRHGHLLRLLGGFVYEWRLFRLIGAALRYTVCNRGEFSSVTQGIPRGSPLSPLLGGGLFGGVGWFSGAV